MNSFQSYHLFTLLSLYSTSNFPIDQVVSSYFRSHPSLGAKDRRIIGDQVFFLIRWQGILDWVIGFDSNWEKRIHAAQTIHPLEWVEKKDIPLASRLSFPSHLIEHLLSVYGVDVTTNFCLLSNQKAPLTIRVNPTKISRKRFLENWHTYREGKGNPFPCKYAKMGVQFTTPLLLFSLPEFKEGLFEIQDEGSQLVADHVNPTKEDQVLDYCAGSGGKTLAFAPKMEGKGQIYLFDIRKNVLAKAKKRLKRAGIQNAQMVTKQMLKKPRFQKKMNWILLDVPCSGTGTFRRNVDGKWRLTREMIDHLVLTQRNIFSQVMPLLHPNGTIVYATCSILPEENEQQISHFMRTYSLSLVKDPFFTFPKPNGMDGFFCALLKKKSL